MRLVYVFIVLTPTFGSSGKKMYICTEKSHYKRKETNRRINEKLAAPCLRQYLIRAIISLRFVDHDIFSFHAFTIFILKLLSGHVNLKVSNEVASVFKHL